jgi:hypothetical protein
VYLSTGSCISGVELWRPRRKLLMLPVFMGGRGGGVGGGGVSVFL